MMSRNCTYLAIAATLAGLTGISGAVAAENWPTSVVGTWQALSNQSPVTITIKSQAINAKCPEIRGTIFDNGSSQTQNLIGSYCPGSGRIVFSRTAPGFTTQEYSANLSEIGPTLHMGGSFEQTGVGEYAFSASK
jgi:hypothetical protein